MAEFVLNRDKTIIGLSGHSVRFEKGVPTFVPGALITEALSIGAERVDAAQAAGLEEPAAKDDEPQGAEREAQVYEAFDTLMASNKREDFTAAGAPHSKALKEILGYNVDAKERDILWAKFRAERGATE